ncbi:hypothetical protein MMC26_002543 [Xylographa opegraphella]|nr:hypothetical protein [Xylographa opegraphella]
MRLRLICAISLPKQICWTNLTFIRSCAFPRSSKTPSRSPAAESENRTARTSSPVAPLFVETGKAYDHDSHKLIPLLPWTKEFDSLHKCLHGAESYRSVMGALSICGQLAGFERALVLAFVNQCNLAALSATALADRVCRDFVCAANSALVSLRETLDADDEMRAVSILPSATAV